MAGVYIRIPKEFEAHFDYDRFVDSLTRLMVDAHCLAGNYEKETAAMLIEVFKKAIPAADVVDRRALLDKVTEVGIRKWNGNYFTTQIIRVIPEEALLAAPAVIPKEVDK